MGFMQFLFGGKNEEGQQREEELTIIDLRLIVVDPIPEQCSCFSQKPYTCIGCKRLMCIQCMAGGFGGQCPDCASYDPTGGEYRDTGYRYCEECGGYYLPHEH